MTKVISLLLIQGLMVVAGCTSGVQYLDDGREAIGARVQVVEPSIAATLERTANPKGVGVIVFTRSDSDCGPRFLWLYLDESTTFAFNQASRALTPGLPLLATASDATKKKIGALAVDFETTIRDHVCRTPRS